MYPNIENYDKIKKSIGCPNSKDLTFIKNFSSQGKQGIAGLVSANGYTLAYKMSQYINHIILHESSIMDSLLSLRNFCPHFCKNIALCTVPVNGNYRKMPNPFNVSTKHPIKTDTLLMEYIDGKKLYSMIKDLSVSDDVIFAAVKQLLFAISIAQEKVKFTHYDLHSCNVLMKKCNPKSVALYVLDDDNQFCVPTFGYMPVIIDFGFSYANSRSSAPIYSSLAHTDVGFMTNQFDPIADPKLLLVSISEEIKRYRSSETSIKFRNIVRNIFACLDIDWESGWDNYDTPGATDHILEEIEKISVPSNIFKKYPHYCIDIVQTLIQLPLEKLSKNDLEISYITMVNEFYKIEKELTSSIYHVYIFKNIVDSARKVRSLYSSNRTEAVKQFKIDVLDVIRSVADFCIPKKLHYERLLCSLYCFANASQRILHDVIKIKNSETKQKYDELPLNTVEQIYGAIETNIKHQYTFDKYTTINVYDSHNECNYTISHLPSELINILNNTHPLVQGSIIYEYSKHTSRPRQNSTSHDTQSHDTESHDTQSHDTHKIHTHSQSVSHNDLSSHDDDLSSHDDDLSSHDDDLSSHDDDLSSHDDDDNSCISYEFTSD
jgi:hypothetical protein